MSYSEEKLQHFEDNILAEADEKIAAMFADLNQKKEQALKAAEKTETNKMNAQIKEQKQQLQWKYRQAVTKTSLLSKQQLLRYRNQLTKQVFEQTEKKLSDFADSAQYQDYMLKALKQDMEVFPYENSTLQIRKKDAALIETLQNLMGSVSIEFDLKNQLGGYRLINREKGLLLDQTFASKLDNQKTYFYQHCRLTVTA